LLQIVTINC